MVLTASQIKQALKAPKFLLPDTIRELKDEGEYGPACAGMLQSLCGERCGICQGIGHNAKRCPVLKAMDAMTKESKILKKVWGTYKGKKKNGGKQGFIAKASAVSLQNSVLLSKANLSTKMVRK